MDWFVFSNVVFAVGALIALTLLVYARFERRRGPTQAYDWLAGALVAFVFLSIPTEQLGYDFNAADNAYWMRLSGLGLVLFPGLLARSICALCSTTSWGLRASDALAVVLGVVLLAGPTFPGLGYADMPRSFQLLQVGIVVEIVLAVCLSVLALRRASRGQPLVVQRRARLLIGVQIVFGVTVIGWLSSPQLVASIIANAMMLVVGALLIVALAWPHVALPLVFAAPRDTWASFSVLMASHDVRPNLLQFVEEIVETWGFAGAAVIGRDGRAIECCGQMPIGASRPTDIHQQRFKGDGVTIVVWMTPLSLPLTRRDHGYLNLLATMIRFALDREDEFERRSQIAASEAAAAASLAEANMRLVEADEIKSRFVSTASHELRTPLTSIIGLARTCSQRWDELDEQQLRSFQEIVVEQGERLERIVDNLLTTSSIDAGMIGRARDRINLGPLIDLVVASVASGFSRELVEVDVAVDGATVIGDEQAIYEILVNLLANAYKYGDAPIRVRTVRRDREVLLIVEDSGRGVDPVVQHRVFERFARGVHLDQPGTGLGLSIVHDLARALDGNVGFRPLDSGSRFWVSLPAAS